MKENCNLSSPSIFSVPLWTISKRLFEWIAVPSLNHLMSGVGAPAARHVSIATLPFGSVWFVGPIWMIGGGMSSTDMTWKEGKENCSVNIDCRKGFYCFEWQLGRENIWSATSSLPYQLVYRRLATRGVIQGSLYVAHVFTSTIFNHWHCFPDKKQ